MGGQKGPTIEERRKTRVEHALKTVERAEKRFDARIGDKVLKNEIQEIFHSIDKDLKVVRFIKKEDKEDFFDNPYFNQLTERQYRAVLMYVDALTELTFAESSLMFNTDDVHNMSNYSKTNFESELLIDQLERLGNMYKEGLISDEEFAAMKKKLIEGN